MTADATANAPHMPRNFDPMAYAYVGAFDAEPEPGSFFTQGGFQDYTMEDGSTVHAAHPVHAAYLWLRGLLDASPTSTYRDRGQCDHCGARIRYVVVLRHLPTGDHLAVGETCADHRVRSMDRMTWQVKALREAAQAARKAKATRAARMANADAAQDVVDFLAEREGFLPRILWDMRKMHDEGRVWTEQGRSLDVDFIGAAREAIATLAREDAERAARKAEREANATPAPSGKATVLGTILSVKAQEGDYGTTWKMLVDDDRGFRVWSTIPSAILYAVDGPASDLKGHRVTFSATLTPKDTDPTFAIAKRPTKPALVDEAPEAGA